MNLLIEAMKAFFRLGHHYGQIGNLFKGFSTPSYGQDKRTPKSKVSQCLDYLYLFFVLRMLPTNYHLFQFDTKSRQQFKDYMDEPSSPALRHKLYKHLWDDAYSSLVNDKHIFHCICRQHHLPVPRMFGRIRKGVFISVDGEEPARENRMCGQVVLKPVRGMQGKGIHFVDFGDIPGLSGKNKEEIMSGKLGETLLDEDFVVQEVIKQHPLLDSINPYSLNTVRIITLLNPENQSVPLAAMLRTSSNESPVDNFTTGGIVVGIDLNTGNLKPTGFLKAPYGTILKSHPVTGILFSDVRIPYWQELKEVSRRAQEVFHQLKAIGWDFAITKDGPVLIEGNIEWGTAGIQAATGGLLSPKNRQLLARYGLRFK
jgi:hypothetical protein